MVKFKILSLFLCSWTPKLLPLVPSNWFTVKFAEQNSRFLPFLGGICMEGTLRMSNFKILSTRCIKLTQKTTGAKISAF
jgi:hypothetical protein